MPACALKFSTTDVTLLVCSAGGETCLCQIDTMNDCSSMGCPARLQFNGFSGEAPTLIACQTAAQWVVRRGCSVEVGVASVSLHFAPQLTFTRIDRLPCGEREREGEREMGERGRQKQMRNRCETEQQQHEQSRAEQSSSCSSTSRAEQSRAKQSRAEQSREEQSRAEQSRATQRREEKRNEEKRREDLTDSLSLERVSSVSALWRWA